MNKNHPYKQPPLHGRRGFPAAVVSSTFVSTLIGLAGLGVTAHAATQLQSQTTATQQTQEVNSRGSASVSTTQTYGLNSQQLAASNGLSIQPMENKNLTVGTAQRSDDTSPQPGQVRQQESVTSQSLQSAATPPGPGPTITETATRTSGGPQVSQSVQITSSPSPQIFAGYGVFDLEGHLLSNNLTGTGADPGNGVSDYTMFYPGIAVILVVKAVDTQGNPMPSPFAATVYFNAGSSGCSLENVGGKNCIRSLNVPPGSTGVPFVYTNTGLQANHDSLDAGLAPPWHKPAQPVLTGPTVVQHIRLTAMQTAGVASSSPTQVTQTQSTQAHAQQSQQVNSNPPPSTPVTQAQGGVGQQSQSLSGQGPTRGAESQLATLSGGQLQSHWSTGSPTQHNSMNLVLAQTQQTAASANGNDLATQTQSLSFAATAWMRLFLLQNQQVSSTEVTQSEGMQALLGDSSNTNNSSLDLTTAVSQTENAASQTLKKLPPPPASNTASGSPSNSSNSSNGGSSGSSAGNTGSPNGGSSTQGNTNTPTGGSPTENSPATTQHNSLLDTLYVYLNNVLKDVFHVSGGTVTATEQQSATTANPQAATGSTTVSYEQDGKRVTTAIS